MGSFVDVDVNVNVDVDVNVDESVDDHAHDNVDAHVYGSELAALAAQGFLCCRAAIRLVMVKAVSNLPSKVVPMRQRKPSSVRCLSRCRSLLLVLAPVFACPLLGAQPARGDGGQAGAPPFVTSFSLEEVTARAGETFILPLSVRADAPLAMISWSVEFDPSAFEFVEATLSPEIEPLLAQAPENDTSFTFYHDNDEGWVQGSLVFDFQGRDSFSLPPEMSFPVNHLRFRVRGTTSAGTYPVVFTRSQAARYHGHFLAGSGFVYNVARRSGRPFTPEDQFDESTEAGLEDGAVRVGIIGDVGIFVRGDANLDEAVDVSDPVRILNTLFLGGEPLGCEQAADANRDNRLDISDPVTILNYLFLETSGWSPTPDTVSDEADSLSCSR
jgi:hypothetical protein